MNATERSQESAQARPQAFEGVSMNFSDAIAVIIARPLLAAVTNGSVRTKDRHIAVRLVGVEDSARPGAAMDVPTQGFAVGIGFDSHPHVSGVAPHHADNRRTVIGIGASSTTLVGSTARWVSRVKVRLAFFPPRSETFRH